VTSPARDVELARRERPGHQLGGEDLLLAPDHAVLERGVDVVLVVQAMVHHLDVVDEADADVEVELLDLVEVERR
jgi:hypothetical protein